MADVETEREMSRTEVAEYLHTFANRFGGADTNDRTHGASADTESANADSAEAFVGDSTDDETDGTTREHGGSVTFTVGGESTTVNPPETVQFRLAVDSTSGMLESGEHETVAFTLEWDSEPTEDDDTLDIR